MNKIFSAAVLAATAATLTLISADVIASSNKDKDLKGSNHLSSQGKGQGIVNSKGHDHDHSNGYGHENYQGNGYGHDHGDDDDPVVIPEGCAAAATWVSLDTFDANTSFGNLVTSPTGAEQFGEADFTYSNSKGVEVTIRPYFGFAVYAYEVITGSETVIGGWQAAELPGETDTFSNTYKTKLDSGIGLAALICTVDGSSGPVAE